jgi:predicted ATPase
MINQISLRSFKCFKKETFNLSNLNVLTGLNGTGKSTLIQSLLLLVQSNSQKMINEALVLNGNYINIGTGKDLYCEQAEDPYIVLSFNFQGEEILFSYSYTMTSSFLPLFHVNGDLKKFTTMLENIEYINALRIVPNSVYPKSDYTVLHKKQLGSNGEFAIQYLSEFGFEEVQNSNVLLQEVPEKYLKNQLLGWFHQIVPNTQLDIDQHINTELVSLKYRFKTSNTEVSNYYRPTNVGFGLTYTLPILIALLKAKRNDIVIIENPEAHLHPAGQRKIGELISLAAAGGVQIILETHSDHVLNGIRVSVKKGNIESSKVKIMFFERSMSEDLVQHIVHTPKLFEDGRLSFWPEGFFDEWDKAIEELF